MKSKCHNAEMRVEGDTTKHYICTECEEPCDGVSAFGVVENRSKTGQVEKKLDLNRRKLIMSHKKSLLETKNQETQRITKIILESEIVGHTPGAPGASLIKQMELITNITKDHE